MFEPESGISTCIIILQKIKTNGTNIVKCLDLSEIDNIIDKYNYFADVVWKEHPRNKNDIISFKIKKLEEIKFESITQNVFYNNIDYVFNISNDIFQKIENGSDFLETILKAEAGVISGQDDLFVDYDYRIVEKKVKEFIQGEKIDSLNKMLREKLSKLEKLPKFNADNIVDYVKGENIEKYYFNSYFKLYYEPDLLLRPGIKNNKMRINKLIVFDKKSTYTIKAVVTDRIIIPKSNNEVRFYYSTNDDIDYLYYCCGILNSSLMKFYYSGKMGNRQFPIKKINDNNKDIYELLVQNIKQIHKITSDFQKLKIGKIDFESKYFINNIINELEVYPIEEKNKYFDLHVPKNIGSRLFIESPQISEKDDRIIKLNKDGLELICKDKNIAKILFEHYFKHAYGDLNELDIYINITQMDESKFNKIKNEISEKIRLIENKINILVYALYFDIKVDHKHGKILNEKKILSNKFVKAIEKDISTILQQPK